MRVVIRGVGFGVVQLVLVTGAVYTMCSYIPAEVILTVQGTSPWK